MKPSRLTPKYLSILFTILVLGCHYQTEPYVWEFNKLNTSGIQEGEAIVILHSEIKKSAWGYWHEGKIGQCISKAFKEKNRKIMIFPSEEFRRTFSSDLKFPDAYSFKEVFDSISMNKETLQHIESLNIHYVVLTSLSSDSDPSNYLFTDSFETIRSSSTSTWVDGEVFDIKQKCESGKISVSAQVNGYFRNERSTVSGACETFGKEFVKLIMGQETNK